MARIINGSSQAVRVRRGDVSGSEKKFSDKLHEILGICKDIRVKALISRLEIIMLIHIM